MSGRSRRTEFWLFWLAAMILQMLTGYIDAATSQAPVAVGMGPFTLVTTLILLVPAAMVGIRRLHDIGRSGWWMLLFGIPYAAWLFSMDSGSQGVIPALALLLGSVILLVLLVQPGMLGDNAYGANPKTEMTETKSAD